MGSFSFKHLVTLEATFESVWCKERERENTKWPFEKARKKFKVKLVLSTHLLDERQTERDILIDIAVHGNRGS